MISNVRPRSRSYELIFCIGIFFCAVVQAQEPKKSPPLPALEGAAQIEYEQEYQEAAVLLQRVLKIAPQDFYRARDARVAGL